MSTVKSGGNVANRMFATLILFLVLPTLSYAQSSQELQRMRQQAIRELRNKSFDKAIELYEKIVASESSDVNSHYNLACAYSLKGDKKAAIEALKGAIKAGYGNPLHTWRDRDFDNIRKEPEYLSAVLDLFKKRFGKEYNYEVDKEHMLIYVVYATKAVFSKIKNSLNDYAAAQWKTLFDHKPDYHLLVLIPSPQDSKKMAPGHDFIGYYSPKNKELVTTLIGLSLTHEFTHALHFADCGARAQQHPIWIEEGFATLFENSELKDGTPTPVPNFRLSTARKVVGTEHYVPWEKLFSFNQRQFEGRKGYIHYALARYTLYYFWHKGKLKKWYDTYCANYGKDKTGKLAVEKVFGKPLEKVEEDFKKWIPKAPWPEWEMPDDAPIFKGMTQGCVAGIQVISVGRGSGVEKAGIKPCDIIIEFAGRKYTDHTEFLKAVSQQKAGKPIKVKILRGKKKLNLTLALDPRK